MKLTARQKELVDKLHELQQAYEGEDKADRRAYRETINHFDCTSYELTSAVLAHHKKESSS